MGVCLGDLPYPVVQPSASREAFYLLDRHQVAEAQRQSGVRPVFLPIHATREMIVSATPATKTNTGMITQNRCESRAILGINRNALRLARPAKLLRGARLSVSVTL
jgi:hypothetical protein